MLLTLKRSLTIVLALLLAAPLSACQRGASDAPADGGAQAEAPLAAPQDAGSRP
jgi:hypothetical protein